MRDSDPPGPLDGTRVLELASFITGPYAAALLAQLGAEVIKVEPPTGDPFRGPTGYGSAFCSVNFNKRSVAVDLRSEDGRETVARLARDADVVIENYRPGVAQRLGIDHEALAAMNPRLIYCSISGLDGSSEMERLPAYDSVAQAFSGLLLSLVPADDPVPVGPPLSDMITGVFATTAILAALQRRQQTGLGGRVDLSMLSSSLSLMGPLLTAYRRDGDVPDSRSRTRRSLAFGLVASDGLPFVIHVSTASKFWLALCDALNHPEWRDDPRFATYEARVTNYEVLAGQLQLAVDASTRDEAVAQLRAHDVPCAPAYTIGEVLDDDKLGAGKWTGTATHAIGGELLGVRFPARFDGFAPSELVAPDLLGATDRDGPEADDVSWTRRSAGVRGAEDGNPIQAGENDD